MNLQLIDAGIGHFDYILMSRLSEVPERTLRISELAARVDASLSRLSHTLTRLEKSGWIERSPDPDDGRFNIAALTESGYAKVVDSAPGHVAAVRNFVFEPLTDTQSTALRSMCEAIIEATRAR